MSKLKVGFVDIHNDIAQFFYSAISTRYEIEVDNKNPDYLIFCDENFGMQNKAYSKKDCTKIFYTGENRRPENYDCHYAISFDHRYDPWHYRLPLFVIYSWTMKYIHNMKYDYLQLLDCNPNPKKDGFCSFVVSNPNGQERNTLFEKLNKIKKVDSAGKHLKNIDVDLSTHESKMDFLSSRKFNICFENSSYPGYVTEKITQAFLAGTVPIYWGSPTVWHDFNRDAFINAAAYPSFDVLIEDILTYDQNESLYMDMLMQPKFVNNLPPSYYFIENFMNWFDAIVNKRIPSR